MHKFIQIVDEIEGRQWCEEHGKDTIVISHGGKKIFEAKLLDFEKEEGK